MALLLCFCWINLRIESYFKAKADFGGIMENIEEPLGLHQYLSTQ